ncbi:NUDIX hydrolase [bacterium]|nr:NUDIX hydrolase [bacterium]
MSNPNYQVTKKQHLAELTSRVTPILNVDIIVRKEGLLLQGKKETAQFWQFPGGRIKWDETPENAALRILETELPGVTASLKKLVTVQSDIGWDNRAYGVTIYYLMEYISGEPTENENFGQYRWIERDRFIVTNDTYAIDQQLAKELDVAIRSINISEDEVLVEVDQNDQEIGKLTRKLAHKDNTRFHRAAHLMIFTSKGEIILQQRSFNKMTGPGAWDMPGGHQVFGQTIEQCAQSELAEEMGIHIPLTFVRKWLHQNNNQSKYYYLYSGISDGPYAFDKNEVEQIKVFDCEKLLMKEYPEAEKVLPHVFKYIEELRPLWEKLKSS